VLSPFHQVRRTAWRASELEAGDRVIPEEMAVALSYNGSSYAVMMATPRDFEDFAIGFSLTERIIESPDEIESFEVVEQELGVELRMWLSEPRAGALTERRRFMAGPTGCGLCGIDSLAEAMRVPPVVSDDSSFTADQIMAVVDSVADSQWLNQQTRAVHGAAFWRAETGLVAIREDVGRHNALDKLVGALARSGGGLGSGGIGVLTSRVSVEMIQKSAIAQFPVLVAVSAPTALAVRLADAAGLTLAAVARKDGFEIFTHPHRIRKA
jgi:FdhD protein